MGVGEDPTGAGLVLEWVYGSIVSTAEKARDGAKRTLGAPRPQSVPAANSAPVSLALSARPGRQAGRRQGRCCWVWALGFF